MTALPATLLSGLPVCISTNLRWNWPACSFRHDLHLLHLHVNERVRLHQTAVKRQVLVEARDLALHVADTALDLLVALPIDAARHVGGFQLASLLLIFRFELAHARARR